MADAYQDLIVWQKATRLALEIYRSTQGFPRHELYGLTSQMRRAAVSVASNIAEGKGRFSRKEFAQFLYRARGSLLELETQMFIAGELGYLDQASGKRMLNEAGELGRILNGLTRSLHDSVNTVPES